MKEKFAGAAKYLSFTDQMVEREILEAQKNALVTFVVDWSFESQSMDFHNMRLSNYFPKILICRVETEENKRLYSHFRLVKCPSTLFILGGNIIYCLEGCPSFDQYKKLISAKFQMEPVIHSEVSGKLNPPQ